MHAAADASVITLPAHDYVREYLIYNIEHNYGSTTLCRMLWFFLQKTSSGMTEVKFKVQEHSAHHTLHT